MVRITSETFDDEVLGHIQRVKDNDSSVTFLHCIDNDVVRDFTSEQWEQLGRGISNNTHLNSVAFSYTLFDDNMSSFFGGLTGNNTITKLSFSNNDFSVSGMRSMVPFLQHATNLRQLNFTFNNLISEGLKSEGFNLLLRALKDSPIKRLICFRCGIETIDIDNDFPKELEGLYLKENNIKSDGCRELAKLLRREDTSLTCGDLLNDNEIGDEGVAILVDALQNNSKLELLEVRDNGISQKGELKLLQLVNDISSIDATLRSNHTLKWIDYRGVSAEEEAEEDYSWHIDFAAAINRNNLGDPEGAGREKVIHTHFNRVTRAKFAEPQGVSHCVYSEINPLHLPEVLSLVSKQHGQGELYTALKLSIAAVISIVDMKQYVKKRLAYCAAKSEQLRMDFKHQMAHYKRISQEMNARLAAIEAAERISKVEAVRDDDGSQPSKRSRM